MAKAKGKDQGRAAKRLSERKLGLKEASGVAWLGAERFLVVDDERGLFWCEAGHDPTPAGVGLELGDLEGICLSEDGRMVNLLVERDGCIWQAELSDDDLGPAREIGRLPKLNDERNQGWEGIAVAPAGTLGAEALLVAVHQVSPRRVGLFSLEGVEQKMLWRLPKKARKVVDELNDVTVDPRTGHLLVLSGKAGALVELRVEGGELAFVRALRIATKKSDIPEGLTTGEEGRVWIVTDGKGMLREHALG